MHGLFLILIALKKLVYRDVMMRKEVEGWRRQPLLQKIAMQRIVEMSKVIMKNKYDHMERQGITLPRRLFAVQVAIVLHASGFLK